MTRSYLKVLYEAYKAGLFYPFGGFCILVSIKANPERQRQKVMALAYTKTFFACEQLRNRLAALQPPVRRNKKEG